MNKKVMAVAVAGALAMPAVAFAQASTVSIYGLVNVEYGFTDQPRNAAGVSRPNFDGFNSGASRIGFRGEEKLGGGLSAWFQCESQLNVWSNIDTAVTGWCGRNSALGLKGSWGNFYVGSWDTPLKRAVGITRMTNETGWLATAHILSSDDEMGGVADFSNRPRHSINYDTPSFNGFSASFQITSGNRASGDLSTNTDAKGRQWSVNGIYRSGPLAVVAGYEQHKDESQHIFSGAGINGKDKGWVLGASYVFGPVKVGFTYLDLESSDGTGATAERKNWNLAGEWRLGGPHMVRLGYVTAGDLKGSAGVAVPDSGVKQWQISYNYAFSKRTTGYIGYVHLDNDRLGEYILRDSVAAGTILPGENQRAFALGLQHTF